jgi:hypothetical protein
MEQNLSKTLPSESSFKLMDWIFWKILLPLLLIMAMWPIYKWIFDLEEPFRRTFAHGDLLVYSALIMIEAAVEVGRIRHQALKMGILQRFAQTGACLLILGFGVMKYKTIISEHEMAVDVALKQNLETVAHLSSKMWAFSCLNCTIGFIAVAFSVYVFWLVAGAQRDQQLETVGKV